MTLVYICVWYDNPNDNNDDFKLFPSVYDNAGAQLAPIAIAAQNNMMTFVYDSGQNPYNDYDVDTSFHLCMIMLIVYKSSLIKYRKNR